MRDDRVVLMVHGGAGPLPSPEEQTAMSADLERSLRAGLEALRSGSATDAVEGAIRVLEDSPLFNAGRGAALHREGGVELDAALMEGAGRRAGGVACVSTIRNPIAAARAVLERSGHVLMAGPGAEAFARAEGLETVDPAYFVTEGRRKQLEAKLGEGAKGTVGAVAIDRDGHLAAGSSTGGVAGQRVGRVGDSPVVGAGLYAEDGVAAVSCTGDGEFFLRLAAAHELIALIKYRGLTVPGAAREVIRGGLARLGGEGGVLVLGDGVSAWAHNTEGMSRGRITESGQIFVAFGPEADADG